MFACFGWKRVLPPNLAWPPAPAQALSDLRAREEAAERAAEEARKREALAAAIHGAKQGASASRPGSADAAAGKGSGPGSSKVVAPGRQDELHLMALRQVEAAAAAAAAAASGDEGAAAGSKESGDDDVKAEAVMAEQQETVAVTAAQAGEAKWQTQQQQQPEQPAEAVAQSAAAVDRPACDAVKAEQQAGAGPAASEQFAVPEQAAGDTAAAAEGVPRDQPERLPGAPEAEQHEVEPATAASAFASPRSSDRESEQASPAPRASTPPSLLVAVMRLADDVAGFLGGGAAAADAAETTSATEVQPGQVERQPNSTAGKCSSSPCGSSGADEAEGGAEGLPLSLQELADSPVPAVAAAGAGSAAGKAQAAASSSAAEAQAEQQDALVHELEAALDSWPQENAGWGSVEDAESVCSSGGGCSLGAEASADGSSSSAA